MNSADWFIVGLILVSSVIGILRGFMREAVSLATWMLGLWLAWTFSGAIEPHLGGMLGQPNAKVWVARLIILVVVLLIGTLAGTVVSYIMRHSPFSAADRTLGMFFGLLRGAVLVGVAVIVGELVKLDQESWWDQSRLLPYAEHLGDWIRHLVDDVEVVIEKTVPPK
jgi:membrane protein required for colicin V production